MIFTDDDVCEALGIANRTLYGLLLESKFNGIEVPTFGNGPKGKLRRWKGGPLIWAEWLGEVLDCRHGSQDAVRPGRSGGNFKVERVVEKSRIEGREDFWFEKSKRATPSVITGDHGFNPIREIKI